ncbi:MAG: hypothetical protein ACYDEY_01560 [Acidimicrobiales bacterium]
MSALVHWLSSCSFASVSKALRSLKLPSIRTETRTAHELYDGTVAALLDQVLGPLPQRPRSAYPQGLDITEGDLNVHFGTLDARRVSPFRARPSTV